jgi:hypothetical protein
LAERLKKKGRSSAACSGERGARRETLARRLKLNTVGFYSRNSS